MLFKPHSGSAVFRARSDSVYATACEAAFTRACLLCVTAVKPCTFIWVSTDECAREDMIPPRTALLMGAYSIRDTYTTQAYDNANTDPSSWCFYSKIASFLGKPNGALADGWCILMEFFP